MPPPLWTQRVQIKDLYKKTYRFGDYETYNWNATKCYKEVLGALALESTRRALALSGERGEFANFNGVSCPQVGDLSR